MQIPGANIASSIAGAFQAKSREAASKLRAKRHEPAPELDRASADEEAAETEISQAARRAAGNDQEEAHEDRQEHDAQRRPRLDLEG